MHKRKHKKLLHEGKYVAEVMIELIDAPEDEYAPYISPKDAVMLDTIRESLRGDLSYAKKHAKVYLLTEVAA